MFLNLRLSPEAVGYEKRAPWEKAGFWVDRSYRPLVANARASASLLCMYLVSYRQRENVVEKTRFWVLYLDFIDALGRIYNVPTRKNTRREDPGQGLGPLTFLNLRLSEAEMDAMDETKATPAQIMSSLAAVVEGGLAFSLNWNSERETANATFMDKQEASPCKGYALSAFGVDVLDALKILLYKHLNVLGGDWTDLVGKPQSMNKRG